MSKLCKGRNTGMTEVPTLSEYDAKKAKVRCSIQWVLSQAYQEQAKIHKVVPPCDIAHIFESDGGLKKSISLLLCCGEPYCMITSKMFNLVEALQSHEDVIQVLCSKGLYVLDEADSLITANDLRKMPLALGAHLTIIDMLMFAHVSHKLISINSLVITVKKFSEFSASKELPDNLEEALMLWLNKVSLKVQINHRNSLESDKHTFGQQREGDAHFPCVSNLTEDLYDGRSIALLLHYYCPNHILLTDISLKEPMSIADAWSNLQLVFDFCNTIILPQTSLLRSLISPMVLHPVDLLYCGNEMKLNIMVLLGTLYHYLETDNALDHVVSPLGHTVSCRRQRDNSYEDISNEVTKEPLSFTTSKERHKRMLQQANQLVPGVQPLISDATKQSFRKATPDTDSLSTITLNESEGRGSPAPFSSKPLLVRRNREMQQSSTSKPYMRTPVQHLPVIQAHQRQGLEENDDSSSSGFQPSRKMYSSQGLFEDPLPGRPQPTINMWHPRTDQMIDLGNTNMSNNSSVLRYEGYSTDQSGFSKTTADTNHRTTSDVPSSTDAESETLSYRQRLPADGHRAPFTDFSYVPTILLHDPFSSPHDKNRDRNDMVLESARTSEYDSARTQRTLATESSGASDLTTVTATSLSNEVVSQEFTQTGTSDETDSRGLPSLIATDQSPDLPRNVTRVKPCYPSNTERSTASAPSQKSYTIQNGEFNTTDAARAAGYPIIETSPKSHHQRPLRVRPDTHMALSPNIDPQTARSSMPNGSGDHGRSQPLKAKPIPNQQNEMVIGGTVVKLRSPQRKSNRLARSAKTSSWVDQNVEKSLSVPRNDQQRRHSDATSAEKIVAAFKKLEQRRLMIEKEKRKETLFRKQFMEVEKEIFGSSNPQRDRVHRDHQRQILPNRSQRTLPDHKDSNKNEETSSDYSSKSPSPSSLHNMNNVDGKDIESRAKPKHHTDLGETSDHQNFFASPLSSTLKYTSPKHSILSNERKQALEHMSQSPMEGHAFKREGAFLVPPSHSDQRKHEESQRQRDKNVSTEHRSAFTSSNRGSPMSAVNSSKTMSSDKTLLSSHDKGYTTETGNRNPNLTSGAMPLETVENATNIVPAIIPSETHFGKVGDRDSNSARNKSSNGPVPAKQTTYDISTQFDADHSGTLNVSLQQHGRRQGVPAGELVSNAKTLPKYQDINILQPLSTEHTTRRSLFSSTGAQDPDTSAEQENVNPNHLFVGNADQTSYDSFSHKIAGIGSNQSTPHKLSPTRIQDILSPPKSDGDSDMASVFLKTADRDRKGGRGFELVDEASPNVDVAKKKEQFLLKQLKKEEELKRKRADREKLEEKRKEEARQKQEEIAAKKEEEKLKRQQILEEYKKRKMKQEEAQLLQQSSAIISGGNSKKHPKPESTPQATKLGKVSRSGRSSPAPDNQHLSTGTHGCLNESGGNQSTFIVSSGVDINTHVAPFRTRKASPARKDWETESASSSAVSSDYTGPKLYKQPSSKSNKHIIYNAICHCCLPGKVNEPQRNNTIQVLEMSNEKHFMILFRDAKCQYRALYTYDPDEEKLHRISGNGPHTVFPSMIERLFKYNSGRKAFTALSSKTLSVSIDGISIKNALWQKKLTNAKK